MPFSPHPLAAGYLFCLGLAVGVTTLAMTSYLLVSPRWLRWLLLASGLLLVGRYVTMALFAMSSHPQELWPLARLWYGSSVSLPFAGAVAVDQLVRHPAMSPKKLLKWLSPFLAAYGVALVFGHVELTSDPLVGMRPKLMGWGLSLLALTHAVFVILLLWIGVRILKKLPSRPLRIALTALLIAYGYLGAEGLLLSVGHRATHSYVFSELTTLACLWFAFETAHRHPL